MRIVQIAATRNITGRQQVYALTDKGDVWLHNEHEWSWDKLPPLPTDDIAAVEHDTTQPTNDKARLEGAPCQVS